MASTHEQASVLNRQLNSSRVSLTTNSTRSNRLTRKRDNTNSAHKNRSRTKERYEQGDFQTYLSQIRTINPDENNYQKNYARVKDGVSELRKKQEEQKKINHPKPVVGTPHVRHLQITSRTQVEERKREPTPVKSRREIHQNHQPPQPNNETEKLQLELKVAGLEHELASQKALRASAEENCENLSKKVGHLKEVLDQLQMQNKILLEEKKGQEERIDWLEKAIMESENTLAATKNTLNKLKQTIKENRINQLQSQIKKISKLNENLTNNVKKLEGERDSIGKNFQENKKELLELKRKFQIQLSQKKDSAKENLLLKEIQTLKQELKATKTQNQLFLSNKLLQKEEELFHMGCLNSQLQMKVHFLSQSKKKELDELRESKASELKKLRVKYSKLLNEQKQKQVGVGKQGESKRPHPLQKRERGSFSFSLSPDYD